VLRVSRRSAPLLLVVACVVASIALSDAASARAWLAGGHATPEQLALHQLYESLGLHDHHGHAPAQDSGAIASEQVSFVSSPSLTVAVPGGAADPGQLARAFQDAIAAPSLVTLARLVNSDDPRPMSSDFLVLDPPPRLAA